MLILKALYYTLHLLRQSSRECHIGQIASISVRSNLSWREEDNRASRSGPELGVIPDPLFKATSLLSGVIKLLGECEVAKSWNRGKSNSRALIGGVVRHHPDVGLIELNFRRNQTLGAELEGIAEGEEGDEGDA